MFSPHHGVSQATAAQRGKSRVQELGNQSDHSAATIPIRSLIRGTAHRGIGRRAGAGDLGLSQSTTLTHSKLEQHFCWSKGGGLWTSRGYLDPPDHASFHWNVVIQDFETDGSPSQTCLTGRL